MSAPRGVRILVVDDDALVRRALCRRLSRRGYAALEARDPNDAIAIAECGDRIDVVLTDVEMPGIDGFMLAARLRERCPSVRIVLMSGAVERVPDGTRVLAKPFDDDTLDEAVVRALHRDARAQELVALKRS